MNAAELIGRVRHLRSPSPAVARLVALLSTADVGNDEIIQVVREDSVLSAKLLALCNSAAFGHMSIASVDEAVFFLGHREVYRLVVALGFGAALTPPLVGYAMEPGSLWRHSLLTAFVSDAVLAAVPAVTVESSVAYTAGLLHDLGKVVLNHVLDEATSAAVREKLAQDRCALVEAERSVIGCDHAEVGGALLRTWRLPEPLVEAVERHHAPELRPCPRLSTIVHIADMLAHQVGAAPGWGSYAVRTGEDVIEAAGLTNDAVQGLLIATSDALDRVENLAAAA